MKQTGIVRMLLTILLIIAGCEPAPEAQESDNSIEKLFDEYYQGQLEFNPIEATQAGKVGYNDKFPNLISTQYVIKQKAFLQDIHQQLNKFDPANLTQAQSIARDVLLMELETRLQMLDNPIPIVKSPQFGLPIITLLPINQIFSMHLYMGQLGSGSSVQPFKTVKDYEDWLFRMEDYFFFLATAIENMTEGIEKGVVHPKIITQRMIDQFDGMINIAVEDHPFYGPVKQMPEDFSQEDKQRFTKFYTEMIRDRLIPAYREIQDFLKRKYLPAGVETSGIGGLPDGKKTYQLLVTYHTTTDMTPDEIHDLGLAEVARIEKEMEEVKSSVGFEGDLKDFFDHVRTSKEQMPFTQPNQVIENFEVIHERVKPKVSQLFDLQPKAGFEIRRTERFREASASAEYNTGSIDGTRPGVFYVPIPDVTNYNKFDDESLFLHEAIPGHHFQLSLQQENQQIPEFMKAEGLGVFVEGWALYCESLGKELGLYEDPYQYFGMLSAEMHRAIRLVVDTGIHSKGWTREQAIQYSLDHEAESEADIIAEIERYMVAPGQALAYKIGQLKIRELRARAEQALGEQFNIKEFHNQVLNSGSLPLEVLEQKIDRWILSMEHRA